MIIVDVGIDHVAPANVRRQRHAPQLFEQCLRRQLRFHVRQPLTFLESFHEPKRGADSTVAVDQRDPEGHQRD